MIRLSIKDLGWQDADMDDSLDRCAHGRVHLEIDETTLVRLEEGPWTLTAAALFLLRTLTDDHTPELPVAEASQLFPCCGFNVAKASSRYPVVCFGCPNGVDVWVRHAHGQLSLIRGDLMATVPLREWRFAVHAFADEVARLHSRSTPKARIAEEVDREAWAAFWREWEALREATPD